MRRIIIGILTLTVLSGCTFFPGVHRIDIHQGNSIDQEMVDQLKPGMTPEQVRFVLGTPLVQSTFAPDRWDYLFYLQKGNGERTEQRVTIRFNDDKLVQISGDLRPTNAQLTP